MKPLFIFPREYHFSQQAKEFIEYGKYDYIVLEDGYVSSSIYKDNKTYLECKEEFQDKYDFIISSDSPRSPRTKEYLELCKLHKGFTFIHSLCPDTWSLNVIKCSPLTCLTPTYFENYSKFKDAYNKGYKYIPIKTNYILIQAQFTETDIKPEKDNVAIVKAKEVFYDYYEDYIEGIMKYIKPKNENFKFLYKPHYSSAGSYRNVKDPERREFAKRSVRNLDYTHNKYEFTDSAEYLLCGGSSLSYEAIIRHNVFPKLKDQKIYFNSTRYIDYKEINPNYKYFNEFELGKGSDTSHEAILDSLSNSKKEAFDYLKDVIDNLSEKDFVK